MKIKILHLVLSFCFLGSLLVKTVALNYTITFTGSGASSTVDSVIVQNLRTCTKVTVPAGNVLNLSDIPNAIEQVNINDETIRVYPTSAHGKSIMSFYAKHAGSTQINAFNLDGRKVAGINTDLQTGSNMFELSLPRGFFVIQVTGNEYAYTDKMLNPSGTQGNSGIVFKGTEKAESTSPQKSKSSSHDVTGMTYAAGDQLLYKAFSGNYSTIETDTPSDSKTMNFDFVACTDADGNNYTVVTIGNQTWIAENLKNTKYNDGTSIPNISDQTVWNNLTTGAYCNYNNDISYAGIYGRFYNWGAVNTGKLAPKGWHVPSDTEWTVLYNFLGSGNLNTCTKFSTQSAGFRRNDGFKGIGYYDYWWSSTENSTYYVLFESYFSYSGYLNHYFINMGDGFSVRCVRDN